MKKDRIKEKLIRELLCALGIQFWRMELSIMDIIIMTIHLRNLTRERERGREREREREP